MSNKQKRYWLALVLYCFGAILANAPLIAIRCGTHLPLIVAIVASVVWPACFIAGSFLFGIYYAVKYKKIEAPAKPMSTIELHLVAAKLSNVATDLVDQLEASTNQVLEKVRAQIAAKNRMVPADPPVDVYELPSSVVRTPDIDDRFNYERTPYFPGDLVKLDA